jgi:DNA-binding MarR family transcriptional regulator
MALQVIPELHRATHRVGLYLEEVEPGLTQGEAHLLAHLHATGGCTIAELHKALAHKRSTLTSLLDRLEARGHTTREIAQEDRRSYLVRLTRSGRLAAARVHAALSNFELAAMKRVTRAELDGFLAVLAALGADDAP